MALALSLARTIAGFIYDGYGRRKSLAALSLPSLSAMMIRNVEVYKKLYEAVGLGFVWKAAELPLVGGLVNWYVFRLFAGGSCTIRQIITSRGPSVQFR